MPPEMALAVEFDQSLIADIGAAILRKVKDDANLRGYFREITDVESEDIYLASGYSTPALLLALDEMQETPLIGGDATLQTSWTLAIVSDVVNSRGTGGFLRARVIERIKGVLMAEAGGVIRDEDGALLTEALALFQRVGRPVLVGQAPSSTIRTTMNVVYTSTIDAATRGMEP